MADIKFDLTWDMDQQGQVVFSVALENHNDTLADFTFDNEQIEDAFEEDRDEYFNTGKSEVLDSWYDLAEDLRAKAANIDRLIQEARQTEAHMWDNIGQGEWLKTLQHI